VIDDAQNNGGDKRIHEYCVAREYWAIKLAAEAAEAGEAARTAAAPRPKSPPPAVPARPDGVPAEWPLWHKCPAPNCGKWLQLGKVHKGRMKAHTPRIKAVTDADGTAKQRCEEGEGQPPLDSRYAANAAAAQKAWKAEQVVDAADDDESIGSDRCSETACSDEAEPRLTCGLKVGGAAWKSRFGNTDDPAGIIGLRMSKQFPDMEAPSAGIVDAYEELSVRADGSKRFSYHVTYDDGDEEHLYTSTLCALISMS
jgi:hypothetical protein